MVANLNDTFQKCVGSDQDLYLKTLKFLTKWIDILSLKGLFLPL
jgi:hypothetical protein